jgi:hypothetical protein
MSAAELNALEREVERTRTRFANDLARLRSPHNIAEFKEDLWAQARNTKDGVLADLKARAAANPLAVAALAAGVAWRLFQRPPVATLLVGLGLVGLLRTSPSRSDYANAEDLFDPGQWPGRASDLADSAKRKVEEWGAQASEAARDAKAQVAETAASMAERASGALRDAGDTAREGLRDAGDTARARMTRFADDAAVMSDQASARMSAVMPNRDDRDSILLGAAALAVAAAVGIAVQRRAHEEM